MINKSLLIVSILLVVAVPSLAKLPSDEADVRAVVQSSFKQLKNGEYSALYDQLPASARRNMTRQRFVNQMQQSRNLYRLDRMDIGTVHINGNSATADTTMYGRVLKPSENEGKIVMRQRLVRENGTWRLAVNSASPRIYIKRDGRWVDVTALLQAGARRR
jgi:competence protein ComGC